MDERDYKAMNEELNQPSCLGAVISCAFLDWVNLHTHFWKSPHMKLWYDKSEFYGTKGFTTMEVYKLFVAQHST
jgi:hypothetical protein